MDGGQGTGNREQGTGMAAAAFYYKRGSGHSSSPPQSNVSGTMEKVKQNCAGMA